MERKKIEGLKPLARKIQKDFKGFYLTGGPALMFRHNHRVSVDLDFFGTCQEFCVWA